MTARENCPRQNTGQRFLPDYVFQSKPTTYLRSLEEPLVIMKFIVAVTYAADDIAQMQFLRDITVRFSPGL